MILSDRTTDLTSHDRTPIRRTALLLIAVMTLGLATQGCRSLEPQAGTPEKDAVIEMAEKVLRERYYQTRPYSSGHLVAYSQILMEGVYKVRHKVDVYIQYENTGHYMPKVYVRKYIDAAEPPLENEDFTSPFEDNHPTPKEKWLSYTFDRNLEMEIRNAILAELKAAL